LPVPKHHWIGDITPIAIQESWLSLAVLLDARSRRVVGWAMAEHTRTELTLGALAMALQRGRPGAGLVHHPDRNCQYTAAAYQACLAERGISCSMSRAEDCLDNAMAASFFATLQAAVVDTRTWPMRAATRHAEFLAALKEAVPLALTATPRTVLRCILLVRCRWVC